MNVGENAYRAAASRFVRAAAFHATPVGKTDWPALYTGDHRENGRKPTLSRWMGWPEASDTPASFCVTAYLHVGDCDSSPRDILASY
jgi:capsular polysaccharide biosynthesis protein